MQDCDSGEITFPVWEKGMRFRSNPSPACGRREKKKGKRDKKND